MNAAEHTHYRTCHLCEAICGVEIRVRGTEILSIRGDEQDPFSRGHLCPKALGLKDIQLSQQIRSFSRGSSSEGAKDFGKIRHGD